MMTFLLQAVTTDTLIIRQVPTVRSGAEQVVFAIAGIAPLITLLLALLIAVFFYRMWRSQQQLLAQLGRLSDKVDPMIESAVAAAENVQDLTDAVRKDAVAAAAALSEATSRVRDAVSGVADRIDDFGNLLGRVHEKADAVVDVAGAAISTLKWGANALNPMRKRKSRLAKGRTVVEDEELDEDEEVEDELETEHDGDADAHLEARSARVEARRAARVAARAAAKADEATARAGETTADTPAKPAKRRRRGRRTAS